VLKQFKEVLPDSARGLVDSIEAACICDIEVRQDSDLLPRDDHSPVACTITKDLKPLILYRVEEDFAASGVVHELLHLERYLVSGVPQLQPVTTDMGGFVEGIENILEHLIIVPKAAEYGFDQVVDEERNASQQWESLTPNAPWNRPLVGQDRFCMPRKTIADYRAELKEAKEQVRDLEEKNETLQEQLDHISDIVAPEPDEDEDGDEEDDDGEEDENPILA
jgi:hypothetical protein